MKYTIITVNLFKTVKMYDLNNICKQHPNILKDLIWSRIRFNIILIYFFRTLIKLKLRLLSK